jgi:Ca2+-transporting ATPase
MVENAHALTVSELAQRLTSSPETGLATAEVARRQNVYGPNRVPLDSGPAWWSLLLRQFWSPLVAVLVLAAGLSYWFDEPVNTWAIVVVLLLNAAIGFAMDWQARRTVDALRQLSEHHATVVRAGRVVNIAAKEVVPGDLIQLEAGQRVPADARLTVQHDLRVDESSLTGESGTVAKHTDPLAEKTAPADRRNTVFSGTIVSRGNATALVTAIGTGTELGHSLGLMQTVETADTPLERKLTGLTHRLIYLTLLLGAVISALGYYRGMGIYSVAETAIALAVAAIPEGLPVVATITLAIGMSRLARREIVVKALRAVETLGETQVLIVDKTGTLTENRLTVTEIVGVADEQAEKFLLRAVTLCNTATLSASDEQTGVGDPLEIALLRYATDRGVRVGECRSKYPKLDEHPFSSATQYMATLHREEADGPSNRVYVKGAPEVVLERCVGLSAAEDWQERAATASAAGLKVLAIADRDGGERGEDFATDLRLLGLVYFSDPPREDVHEAVTRFRRAGIRVIMATGDHPQTARSIAHATGLIDDPSAPVRTGNQLVPDTSGEESDVYARVTPAQKLELLHGLQRRGHVVAMVGDGVNDAPALRQADIGVAMGEGGTEAAREAADLVLRRNALGGIVEAVRQGRGIFDNIRQFVVYLLSCNLAEILVVGGSFFLPGISPLLPLQILFLNLLTDVFPALALGYTRSGEEVLDRPPRPTGEGILTGRHWRSILIYALLIAAFVLSAGHLAVGVLGLPAEATGSLVFLTLFFAQLWHVLSLPDHLTTHFAAPILHNRVLGGAVLFCILLAVAAYAWPVSRSLLGLEGARTQVWAWSVGFGLLPAIMVRIGKDWPFPAKK